MKMILIAESDILIVLESSAMVSDPMFLAAVDDWNTLGGVIAIALLMLS